MKKTTEEGKVKWPYWNDLIFVRQKLAEDDEEELVWSAEATGELFYQLKLDLSILNLTNLAPSPSICHFVEPHSGGISHSWSGWGWKFANLATLCN